MRFTNEQKLSEDGIYEYVCKNWLIMKPVKKWNEWNKNIGKEEAVIDSRHEIHSNVELVHLRQSRKQKVNINDSNNVRMMVNILEVNLWMKEVGKI